MTPSVSTLLKASVLFAAAAVISVASAAEAGTLGFSLGVKRNSDGQCKETADFERDLDQLKPYSQIVRTYAVSDCNTMQNVMPAIKSKGFKIVLGVWPNDDSHFAAEKATLKKYLPQYQDCVLAITVGSEALYRKEFTGAGLAAKIKDVQDFVASLGVKNIPVGTADSWNILVHGDSRPAIAQSDIILANAFSYWQGQTMANSSHSFYDDIMQVLGTVQSIKGTDANFWVGETGWPTGGDHFETSQPSVTNAGIYWKESICSLLNWGVNIFVFSAFDESWKPEEKSNDVEKHWGVFKDDGTPKYDLKCAA